MDEPVEAEPAVLTGEEARGDDYEGVSVWMISLGVESAKWRGGPSRIGRVVKAGMNICAKPQCVLLVGHDSVLLASVDSRITEVVTRSSE